MPHNVIELVLSNPTVTVTQADGLVKAIMAHRIDENVELVQAYTRMYNLVKNENYKAVDDLLFSDEAEKALFKEAVLAYENSQTALENKDYDKVVAIPETLVPAINKFFEDVMVMVDDEAVKANRLQLVRLAYESMAVIGDVSTLK